MRKLIAIGLLLPAIAAAQQRERLPIEQLRAFTEVYGLIRTNYVDPVEHDVLVGNAIEGLLKVDPHGAYLDRDALRELRVGTALKTGGLGVEVTDRGRALRVVSTLDGGPAARAGLLSDDAIVKIDDQYLDDKTLAEAVQLLRGAPGTTVRLTILRRGESALREFALTRELVRTQPLRARLIGGDTAYVRVAQLQEDTTMRLAKELASLVTQGARRVVLDLRASPGGLLHESLAIAALFLPEKTLLLTTEGRAEDAARVFRADPADYSRRGEDPRKFLPAEARTLPMAVLVDRGTAAGSEIVAAALREHERVVLLGEKTFGRGTIQTIVPLGNSTAVKLTTARYKSPKGATFEGVGLRPDVELSEPVARTDFGADGDAWVRAAIARLR